MQCIIHSPISCCKHIEHMNKFQLDTIAKILERFPEWRPFSNTVVNQYGEEAIVFEIQSPIKSDCKLTLKIIITTEEIIVSFDAFHSHFYDWVDPEPFNSAQSFVEDLFDENLAIVSWWDNDQWKGSSYYYTKERNPTARSISKFNKQVIRSWNGTYNNEIREDAPILDAKKT